MRDADPDNASTGTLSASAKGFSVSPIPGIVIITISAPDELGYQDILAYTELSPEAPENMVHLYHLTGNGRQEVQINMSGGLVIGQVVLNHYLEMDC